MEDRHVNKQKRLQLEPMWMGQVLENNQNQKVKYHHQVLYLDLVWNYYGYNLGFGRFFIDLNGRIQANQRFVCFHGLMIFEN